MVMGSDDSIFGGRSITSRSPANLTTSDDAPGIGVASSGTPATAMTLAFPTSSCGEPSPRLTRTSPETLTEKTSLPGKMVGSSSSTGWAVTGGGGGAAVLGKLRCDRGLRTGKEMIA